MLSLDDFQLFKLVAESGGVSQASRRHGLAKSTLARRLAALESSLGLRLIERGARRFALTDFGERCYAHCQRIAAEAAAVAELVDAARDRPAGALRVFCPPLLGARVIERVAAEFAARAPEVRLHLDETTAAFDPRQFQADLVIYAAFGPMPDSALVARKIHSAPYVLVARPDVIASRAPPRMPGDLAAFDCLGLGSRGADWKWELSRGASRVDFRFEPRFSANVPSALLRAALEGVGVASLPAILCAEELETGRLIRVLEGWRPRSADIHAIYADRKHVKASVRMFVESLRRAFD